VTGPRTGRRITLKSCRRAHSGTAPGHARLRTCAALLMALRSGQWPLGLVATAPLTADGTFRIE
jgi:hypothetical protein